MNSLWHTLLRWIVPPVLLVLGWLPTALAQATPAAESEYGRSPAFPYAVALAATLLVLVIVCAPSRKG